MTAGTSETSASARVTVLVGHGVPAKGTPPEQVARLKALEGARRRSGTAMMSDEEARLDAAIRVVPRTPENDPYDAGLRRLADALAKRLAPEPVLVAFNEFCAPSLDDAIARAVEQGATTIRVVPTMMVQGGVHSEVEIPEALGALRARFPQVELVYCWPFDADALAAVLQAQLQAFG